MAESVLENIKGNENQNAKIKSNSKLIKIIKSLKWQKET
jgi:hypothetical protein